MPECPHCGHTEEASRDWFEYIPKPDGDLDTEIGLPDKKKLEPSNRNFTQALVVCPDCDKVLGGTVAESKWKISRQQETLR